jgi:formylmethanofuran dehydrogenase subunit B
MDEAWIEGTPASLAEAIATAARLLGRARHPVIAGLATDCAGAEAAVGLAKRLGAAIDHAESPAVLADLDAVREASCLLTTPLQMRARADLIVAVGDVLEGDLQLDRPPVLSATGGRRLIRLGTGAPAEALAVELGVLRALVAGRPIRGGAPQRATLEPVADLLRSARYAVIIWHAAQLDPLAVQMIAGLVDDVNAVTRCAGLAIPAGGNASGVAQAMTWRCGFPVRVGYGRGVPEHDPWRFAATRLVESGEADAALWVSVMSSASPPWTRRLPLVLLSHEPARNADAAVAIHCGRPGLDHDAVLFDANLGALAHVRATSPRRLMRAGDVLDRIARDVTNLAPAC